jgi:hypothetical protein
MWLTCRAPIHYRPIVPGRTWTIGPIFKPVLCLDLRHHFIEPAQTNAPLDAGARADLATKSPPWTWFFTALPTNPRPALRSTLGRFSFAVHLIRISRNVGTSSW